MTADATTRHWIRNAADELAVANGCKFDEQRGAHPLEFARRYLRLYEGETAGQPLEPMEWQVEVSMRLFGWVRWSERFKRWVRRFRQASIWVPKKNGKSPTLAWWGLYLLCADGEQGQKVYFAAKDGQQAREIAGKHAFEMVQSSPELMGECSLNRNLMQVTHEPTRSILKPISSADSKTQKAKEGLNGSILVDETHVVDREFMARVSRAGISRAEPLLIEVSTAGNDPDGYGKERFDYGRLVEKAESGFQNDQLLFATWEAPQDITDEQLAADPVAVGKLANPAWGHTIDEVEYLADYNESKRSIQALADFKMYRLDVWQRSANPWLRMGDWERCRRAYTVEDLRGRSCFAGLDLSMTRDLTALVLVFPWDDGAFRLWPYFWMPEDTARDQSDKAPFLEWARAGAITLTPGGTVDYGFIRKQFREACELFDIRELAYDPWQAEKTTQEMSEGVVVEGKEIEIGTGVPRFLFKQSLMNFAGPTEEFEKLTIESKLHHPAHPVLTWQAGHVQVKTDANRNKRPVKPKHGDARTIDGIVAGIMGLARAIQAPDLTPTITVIECQRGGGTSLAWQAPP